jgi:alkaline phosphatase
VVAAEMLDFDDAVGVALAFHGDHPETLVIVASDHETGGITLPTDTALGDRMVASMLDSIVGARGGSGAPTSADSMALREYLTSNGTARAGLVAAMRTPVLEYATGDHTGALVPLFAIGPGAERFGGLKENREIGRLLLEAVRN